MFILAIGVDSLHTVVPILEGKLSGKSDEDYFLITLREDVCVYNSILQSSTT